MPERKCDTLSSNLAVIIHYEAAESCGHAVRQNATRICKMEYCLWKKHNAYYLLTMKPFVFNVFRQAEQ
jgi:hypothetical protein